MNWFRNTKRRYGNARRPKNQEKSMKNPRSLHGRMVPCAKG